MSEEKPKMQNKSTAMLSSWTLPFYDYINNDMPNKRPSIKYVKSFLNWFLTELLNEKSSSQSSSLSSKAEYDSYFDHCENGFPVSVENLSENDNIVAKNSDLSLAVATDFDVCPISTFLESKNLLKAFVSKLSLISFDDEIKYVIKLEIEKTMRNRSHVTDVRLVEKNIEKVRNETGDILNDLVISPRIHRPNSITVKINYQPSIDTEKDSELEIEPLCHVSDDQSNDTLPKADNSKVGCNNITQKFNSPEFSWRVQRLEMYKGNVLVQRKRNTGPVSLFPKLFSKNRLAKRIDSEKSNRLTKAQNQLMATKHNILVRKKQSKPEQNDKKVINKISEKFEEVSVELA